MMRLTCLVSSATDGHGDGDVGFARPAGADTEHHVVFLISSM